MNSKVFFRFITLAVLILLCVNRRESLAQSLSNHASIREALFYYQLNRKAQQLYENALDSYEADDFEAAVAPLERVLALYPNNGKNWIRLGDSRYYSGDYRGAASAYKKARALEYSFLDGNYRFMDYSIAASYARVGEKEKVIRWLKRSLQEERLPFRQRLIENNAIAAFRDDERIRKLIGLFPSQTFETRTEGWRFDLNYLLSEIKRLNATYSERPLPDSIRQAAKQLHREIPKLSNGEIWVQMQQLLAMLGMSHNSVWHFMGADKFEITQLPITFYIFADGLYIIDAEQKNLIGAYVERIGSSTVKEAIERVESVVTSETPMKVKWLGPVYLRMPQVLFSLGLTENANTTELSLRMRNGIKKSVTLKATPIERRRKLFASKLPDAGPVPLYLSRPNEPYWFERLSKNKLAYLQFNQVVNAEDESLSDFALRLRHFLKEYNIKNLVVDIRRNNGGNTFLYVELLRTLIWFDVQKGRQLFVIIGRNTYSAAQNFATDLDRLTEAIFVGEPSGGRPNGHGDESHIILPYSGLHVGLSAVFWQQSHPRDSRLWIAPDVPVSLSAADYFANRDPALSAIRKIIEEVSLLSGAGY